MVAETWLRDNGYHNSGIHLFAADAHVIARFHRLWCWTCFNLFRETFTHENKWQTFPQGHVTVSFWFKRTNCKFNSPHAWRWSLKLQPRAQPGRPRSKTWHTEKHKKKQSCKVISETGNVSYCSFTDQFEHPRAAAACGEAAEQSEDNDDGSGPDEDIWRVGALLSSQGEIGLQAYLPPHANGQQDHACDLETTEGRVSSSIKDQQTNARKAFRTCDRYESRPTSYSFQFNLLCSSRENHKQWAA